MPLYSLVVLANMEPIAHLVKVSIPNYMSGLPIPDTIGGWFRLGGIKLIVLIYPNFIQLVMNDKCLKKM